MGAPVPVSAFIICCNEERNIRRCLESVRWCDEIVVVDSGSTDGTPEICREYTDKVVYHPWEGFVAQKRFALQQCRNEWCLNLDADEEVSPELAKEIQHTLASHPPQAGFELSRVVFHLGKWWRRGGWYPEYRLRLVRRSKTTWAGTDPHERAEVDGSTARLGGELRHYTYTSLADQMRALNSFTSTSAESLFKAGRRASLIAVLTRPIARFIKFYLLRRGFLEGSEGLVVAVIEAFYAFLKYAKLWELSRNRR